MAYFCIFHALSLKLNFFRPDFPFKSKNKKHVKFILSFDKFFILFQEKIARAMGLLFGSAREYICPKSAPHVYSTLQSLFTKSLAILKAFIQCSFGVGNFSKDMPLTTSQFD